MVTDTFGFVSTAAFTWTVNPLPTLTDPGSQTSTVGVADPSSGDTGFCLDAAFSPGPAPTHTFGQAITVQKCVSPTPASQVWSFTGTNNIVATKFDGATQDSLCWIPQIANKPDAKLILGAPCSSRDVSHAFQPDPAVGAGNADASQKFLVNYNQFGRCLDITNGTLPQDPNIKFLIAFPCKVTPDTTKAPTNQQWNFPSVPAGTPSATGVITSVKDSS